MMGRYFIVAFALLLELSVAMTITVIVIKGLRRGKIRIRLSGIDWAEDRHKGPFFFWMAVFTYVIFAGLLYLCAGLLIYRMISN